MHYPKFFNNPNSQYLLIQPHLPSFPWYKQFTNFQRSFIIKLSRLRFGHNRLPVHLKRINITDSDSCPLHPDEPSQANMNHILFECKQLETIRQILYSQILNLHIPTPITAINLLSIENLSIFPHLVQFISHLPPELNI